MWRALLSLIISFPLMASTTIHRGFVNTAATKVASSISNTILVETHTYELRIDKTLGVESSPAGVTHFQKTFLTSLSTTSPEANSRRSIRQHNPPEAASLSRTTKPPDTSLNAHSLIRSRHRLRRPKGTCSSLLETLHTS